MVLALVWLFLVLCNSSFLVCSLDDERVALLSLKQSVSDDPEGSLNNWNSSDGNPCSWNGITCSEGKVVSISIPKKKLVGFLPSGLESLSSLQHLNLKNNKFYGSLPLGLFYVLGLRSLVLSGNTLSGSIPPNIGNLGYLQILDLSQNFLNGSLPTSLIQCKRLRSLDLSHNSFTGSLLLGLVSNALENLNISYNKLSGSIGDLSSLQGPVDLSHNLFSGSIPPSLGNLPEKFYIDLSYNNLSGPIPYIAALLNRGATIFNGNPGLCGPPLKDPCSSNAADVGAPTNNGSVKSGKSGLISKNAVIAVVVSDVVGILFIGWLFSYCYLKMCNGGKRSKGRKECLCFRKDLSETSFENIEQDDLIPLDKEVGFDLDELLKASAFVLGKSGIGIVYKVVLEDGITLAVRRLGEGGSQRFKEFRLEVEAIGELRHPNIVPLRAYYWSLDEKLLIYDYVPNGNLASAIVHGIQSFSEKPGMPSFIPLRWSVRLRIMKGIADGLACLHEFSPKKFVHGNLKTSNILLGQNLEPLIADFGLKHLADIVGSSSVLESNQMTSPKLIQKQSASSESCYQTPEAMKMVKPSQEWDVYSYGLILLELISGRSSTIQISTSGMDLVQWIQLFIEEKKPFSDVLDPLLAGESDREEEMFAVLKIALACVQTNPERRPPMRHVLDAMNVLYP